MNMNYPAIFKRDTNGTILVTFPDVPEATTFGDDEAEAMLRAPDALETALELYMDEGESLPEAGKPRRGQRIVSPSAQAAITFSIYQAMHEQGVRKSDLARKLGWHMPQVDRLLNPHHASRLEHVESALSALGRRLEVRVA